jgi:hypothetical protein
MADDTKPKEERVMGKILDIRNRLPAVIKGSDPSCDLAAALVKVIIEHDNNKPHEWFAALMMTSYALQTMLIDSHSVDLDKMRIILGQAMDIADTTKITIGFKDEPPKEST